MYYLMYYILVASEEKMKVIEEIIHIDVSSIDEEHIHVLKC